MCTILAIGQDDGLLHSRAEILRKCNCNAEVIMARPPEASEILKAQQFDLVVLCHTVSMTELTAIAALAHQQDVGVMVLQVVKNTKTSSSYDSVIADDTVQPDPRTFMEKVEKMLSARPQALRAQ